MNNLTIYAALYVIFVIGAYRMLTSEKILNTPCRRWETVSFYVVLAVVTVGKVALSGTFFGHSSDMSLFSAWADLGSREPLTAFYGPLGKEIYVDYPPLYLYVLTFLGKVQSAFSFSYGTGAQIALIKSVPILFDTVTALIVFFMAKQNGSVRRARVLSLAVLMSPAYLLNSVFWGQIDALYTLVIFSLLYSVYKKKYLWAVLAFTVGMLTKPQMLIFLPLLGFWLLFDILREAKENRVQSLFDASLGVIFSALLIVVCMYPMVGLDFPRFLRIYTSAAGQYPYASLNAANVFGALGLNWADVNTPIFGLSCKSWGFTGIIVTSLVVGYGAFRSHKRTDVFLFGGFTVASIYMLAHMMHERYLFPLILILLITFLLTNDKRMLFACAVTSVLHFVQTGLVLLQNEGIFELSKGAFIAISWVHILLYLYLLAVWFKMIILEEIREPIFKKEKIVCIEPQQEKTRVSRKDVFLMLVLTVVYAISAFFHLGSMNVPQTGFYPEENGETIILDFGEEQTVSRLNFYLGWIDRRDSDSEVERVLTFSFGNEIGDETQKELLFGDELTLVVDSVFDWDGLFVDQTGRYLRLSVDEGDFYLLELAAFDENQNLLTPVSVISNNKTAEKLFDEPDKICYEYTWYDGTYFDEVYHPRTAYEYLNGLWPYENTHPPLGKLIISLGMMLFGVTPFGWRFFGTLCGVLMMPAVYVLAKKLLKETKWAFVACVVFTFDFMHLTQTRLATIDSFTAFFVILMYSFMYQYITQNTYQVGVKKTLLPLFASGLCFGIGIAVKWQGAYAGVGLAVMFFYSLYKRYQEYRAAQTNSLVGDRECVLKTFMPNTIKTILAAVIFFVIIPLIIYLVSYLPIVLSDAADCSYIWENQKSMLSYHSELTATHPYGSAFWSWPLDLRPLYAYNPNRDFVSEGISQGISSFGNPLVWWLTIPVISGLIFLCVKKKGNAEIFTLLTGFGAMYLPWALISRQAFIYHFFPCVPFVAIAAAYCMRELVKRVPKLKNWVILYILGVILLYVVFYPVLIGLPIPTWYADALTWLPTWVLG